MIWYSTPSHQEAKASASGRPVRECLDLGCIEPKGHAPAFWVTGLEILPLQTSTLLEWRPPGIQIPSLWTDLDGGVSRGGLDCPIWRAAKAPGRVGGVVLGHEELEALLLVLLLLEDGVLLQKLQVPGMCASRCVCAGAPRGRCSRREAAG